MVGPFQLPRAIIYIALSTYDELGAAVFITTISTLSGTTSACNGLGYLGLYSGLYSVFETTDS